MGALDHIAFAISDFGALTAWCEHITDNGLAPCHCLVFHFGPTPNARLPPFAGKLRLLANPL